MIILTVCYKLRHVIERFVTLRPDESTLFDFFPLVISLHVLL